MDFLAANAQGELARTQWLVRLRWVAVSGVLAVVVSAGPILDLLPSSWPLLAIVGAMAAWNVVLSWRLHRGRTIQSAARQVVIDLLILSGLLFFGGGLRNPFCIFLVVQVIVGAILLPRVKALRVGVSGALMTLALALLEAGGTVPAFPDTLTTAPPDTLAVWAVALALIITIAVALHLTTTIMEDLRQQARRASRYHEEVARERRKLEEVVRSAGAAVMVLDPDLRLTWSNRRAQDLFGHPPAGEVFRLDRVWPDPDELRAGRTQTREWQSQDRQGRVRVFDASAAPVPGPDGHLEQVALVLLDATERRAAERHLQRTEKLAALGRLAAGVAHEIATPLGSVSILTGEAREALQGGGPEGPQQVLEHLEDIRKETLRISALVRRLLDLAHPGDGRTGMTDVSEVVREAVRLVSVRIGGGRTRIEFVEPGQMPRVETNADGLLQVLVNVLTNAIDASRVSEGPVVVRIETTGQRLVIEVVDRGEGIRAEDLPRVFDPFFTTKDVGEGTGLGLYVSYEIMSNLGGDIEVRSQHGEGTRVALSLPLRDPVRARLPAS